MTASRSRLHRLLADRLRAGIERGEPLRVPEPCRQLWAWFCDLSAARTWHQAGPNPITFAQIEAYARLTRWPLRPEDLAAIRMLDDAWIEATHARMQRATAAGKGSVRPPARRLPAGRFTPAAFDAVLGR